MVKEQREILHTIKTRKTNCIGHILHRDRLLEHVIEGKIEGKTVTRRRGRRCKRLVGDLKEKWGYWKLNAEALDRTIWRTRFGRAYGSLVKTDCVLNGSTGMKYSARSHVLGCRFVKYFLVEKAQSAQWLGYRLGDRGIAIRFPPGTTRILFCKISIPALGPTWFPCSVGAWSTFPDGKADRHA